MITIRCATITDAEQLVAIYAPYVKHTAITFEYDVPTVQAFSKRVEKISQQFPYLVAEIDGEVVGYAYASTYYDRSAYDWSVEVSVYVRQDKRSQRIGSRLYDRLEQALDGQGYVNLLACISLPNDASLAFHHRRGYKQVAHLPEIGYKFNKWHDVVWLQKTFLENKIKQT